MGPNAFLNHCENNCNLKQINQWNSNYFNEKRKENTHTIATVNIKNLVISKVVDYLTHFSEPWNFFVNEKCINCFSK